MSLTFKVMFRLLVSQATLRLITSTVWKGRYMVRDILPRVLFIYKSFELMMRGMRTLRGSRGWVSVVLWTPLYPALRPLVSPLLSHPVTFYTLKIRGCITACVIRDAVIPVLIFNFSFDLPSKSRRARYVRAVGAL